MISFQRGQYGLYFATTEAQARVVFQFQDKLNTPSTFALTASSWTDLATLGFIALVEPSATRDWAAFAETSLAYFIAPANLGAQVAWFPADGSVPSAIAVDHSTASPSLARTLSLAFRRSLTVKADPNRFGPQTTVLFDDASNALVVSALKSLSVVLVSPTRGPTTFTSTSTTLAVALDGPAAGTATFEIALGEDALRWIETGIMFFEEDPGRLVAALSYPVVRAASGGRVSLRATLDVLAPLDHTRSQFEFRDAKIGSYFVTDTGRPLSLVPTATGPSGGARLVFAGRPQTAPHDDLYFYLTPAGRFGLAPDGLEHATASTGAQLLCGATGTEFLRTDSAAAADALDFVPGQKAWRLPLDPTSTEPTYFSDSATTSWVRLATSAGAYVAQPERSPLFRQPSQAEAGSSGLSLHVLEFDATEAWHPSDGGAATGVVEGPLAPMVPYAGLRFGDDHLDTARYLEMEQRAIGPARGHAYVTPAAITARRNLAAVAGERPKSMTPQGMLVGLKGDPAIWDSLDIAISGAVPPVLGFTTMGPAIQAAVQKSQIFVVVSTDPANVTPPLFGFDASGVKIGDWTFDLSPAGTPSPDGTPPIFIMKFYPGQTIEELIASPSLWADPDTFNTSQFPPAKVEAYLTKLIAEARDAVYPDGPDKPADETSLLYNFYQTVTDPAFSGVLAVNCTMRLEVLPTAIRAVLGGMRDPGIKAFRVHHVGISINDTDPAKDEPALSQSSTFALVDYTGIRQTPAPLLDMQVAYLRALFTNSALTSFACKVDLTVGALFGTDVVLQLSSADPNAPPDPTKNVVTVMGSYQANDDEGSDGGVYAFVSEESYDFTFEESRYLDSISLTKLQFSFDDETPTTQATTTQATTTQAPMTGEQTSRIRAHFGIWGSLRFKALKLLDVFAFEKLVFADLAITVAFDLTIDPPAQPTTSPPTLGFSPGNLRLDLGATETRPGETSLLKQLPFKLQSFLYSEHADQTVESLGYYSLGSLPLDTGIALQDRFNYALLFTLDLGTLGGLVSSLSAFKFSILVGWREGADGGIAFAIALPQVDGKLEIKIEGVLTISIAQMNLEYARDSSPKMLVLGLHDCYIEVLGRRMPPDGTISIALFAPTEGADKIGWLGAYNKDAGGDAGADDEPAALTLVALDDGGTVFDLDYLGIGQRVGPDPTSPPTDYDGFLTYMREDFWSALKDKNYAEIYHADSQWLFLTHFALLGKIELGFVFYDVTPFYSLVLKLTAPPQLKGLSFEITYTKVNDSIGMFAAKLGLPDQLRTFEVGAASLTLPNLAISIYTNGNWKVDIGFPADDDWSVSFRVEAMAGPVPVTGSGGFYLASLSSATDPDVFKGTYQSIIAFGFGARLGVGKDFTAGPLKAGVSVTFFGIIQGAAGYLSSGATDIFKTPDALSLQGQFGVIGEIYGSVDFIVIKAAVNVRLQASVGIILTYEPHAPGGGDGSILLYIEASVRVSVTVSIDLFLFSISITYSFNASFRFDWQLAGPKSDAHMRALVAAEAAARLRPIAVKPLALCPGLQSSLPLMILPELTVVFADAASVGVPWFVLSLALPFDYEPPAAPTYGQLKPFEALTTQLTTFALYNVLDLGGYDASVTLEDIKRLDSLPDVLAGWIDYPTLLGQLALFQATAAVPTGAASDPPIYASVFPVPPFLRLETSGRLDASGQPSNLSYQFSDHNHVSASYLALVESYFDQLFVNRTSDSSHAAMLGARAAEATTPLAQEIFLDYFKGLVRGAVHELLVTLQDSGKASMALDALVVAAVGAKRFAALAGQMSSIARGGTRLPYVAGLTVPGGAAQPTTNPLYALLWQEFPVGGFADGKSYTITLSNRDQTQPWLTTGGAAYTLTNDSHGVAPYLNLREGDLTRPGDPVAIAPTQVGPQAFAFENAIVWTAPAPAKPASLRPFPPNLVALQASLGGAFQVAIKSRTTQGAYGPDGTAVPASAFEFATRIDLTVRRIPTGSGGEVLKDVYALSGASQADEALLGLLLDALRPPGGTRPITSIEILYPNAAGAGLTSAAIDPDHVFVLRTNTTTVSQPPPARIAMALADTSVAVGATLALATDGGYALMQIVQQATVTNASGYYLRYVDTAGASFDPNLFKTGSAAISLVARFAPRGTDVFAIEGWYNAIVLHDPTPGLLYYAESVAPALSTRYVALAAGTAGICLHRDKTARLLKPSASVAEAAGVAAAVGHSRTQLLGALGRTGIADADRLRAMLIDAGSVPAALNKLYSLVAYQVTATAGFDASNLSTSFQPQQPIGDDSKDDYRLVAPLYNLAVANRGKADPDRYASIGEAFDLAVSVCDAFGNVLPTTLPFQGTNLYFDGLIPLDQWPGVTARYSFAARTAGVVTIDVAASATAFGQPSDPRTAATLQHLETIRDQIEGKGVSFFLETNLALTVDGSGFAVVPLPTADSATLRQLVTDLVAWLKTGGIFPPPISLSVTVPAGGTLPSAFDISVQLGIERQSTLVDPSVRDLLPSATMVATEIVPATSGAQDIDSFAADFAKSFPALRLAVAMTGDGSAAVSRLARARQRLRAAGVAGDGTGAAPSGEQVLWAVSTSALEISIGTAATSGPRYMSPKPLDNTLNTDTVQLPALDSKLPQLPRQQQFVDVDLDRLNSTFFQAVDNVLAPASAAASFQLSGDHDVYDRIARGRETLAQKFSTYEVDWLFDATSAFTGSAQQLGDGRDAFEQQMRSALMSAYAIDTIVQYDVSWTAAPAADVDDRLELFGPVEATISGGYAKRGPTLMVTTSSPHGLAKGDSIFAAFTATSGPALAARVYIVRDIVDPTRFTLDVGGSDNGDGTVVATYQSALLSTAHVAISSRGRSPITILYGNPDPAEAAVVALDLTYTVTHLQLFLAPKLSSVGARPSVWLKLVEPLRAHVGPSSSATEIPVVLRQYPTPPAIISQGWTPPKAAASSANPIVAAAGWTYGLTYQATLAAQDQINLAVSYNTDFRSVARATMRAAGEARYSLFEALARFSAVFGAVQTILGKLDDPRWGAAMAAFANAMGDVETNTTWQSGATQLAAKPRKVSDKYILTDRPKSGQPTTRVIEAKWLPPQGQSSFTGAKILVSELDPKSKAYPLPPSRYPNQTQAAGAAEVIVTIPNLSLPEGAPVTHRFEVAGLNVLAAENAIGAVGIERNQIALPGSTDKVRGEYVYKTAPVRPSQAVTPFIQFEPAIDVATLPNQGKGTTCPPSPSSLCQRIHTMMADLLADPEQSASLQAARATIGATERTIRRVKVVCSYQFPVNAVVGGSDATISPLVPVALARSFDIDADDAAQIGDFAGRFAAAIIRWAGERGIVFGRASTPALSAFVFDVTLYAALSGMNTPVLRLANLRLKLTDVDPV